MHAIVLTIHIICGTAGLIIGPFAMGVRKLRGRHTNAGYAYQAATLGLCASGIGLAIMKPSVWWLAIIAVATEIAALGGWAVARKHRGNWIPLHLSLMCGSYVSFVTAFAVVNFGLNFWPAWIVPSIIGSPLIARAAAKRGAQYHARTTAV